ncbi:ComF family protein [Thalassotalea agarivorans]|nr:ComF family protein [Thalassotalea agarivorans]
MLTHHRYLNALLLRWIRRLKTLVGQCMLCKQNSHQPMCLCKTCYSQIPRINLSLCHQDLLHWPNVQQKVSHKHFNKLIALSPYQQPTKTLLHALKYQRSPALAAILGNMMARHCMAAIPPDMLQGYVVTSVPLNMHRWSTRGYNQASELAKHLANKLDLPLNNALCYRVKATEQQVGKSGVERRRNLKQAFALARHNNIPMKIILVDDVLTTGTTVDTLAQLLKRAGAKDIIVVTAAIAITGKLPIAPQVSTQGA